MNEYGSTDLCATISNLTAQLRSVLWEPSNGMVLTSGTIAVGRNALHTTEQFKSQPRSILLATGAAWEGFDFPGDGVSLLIIPRLPSLIQM